MANIYRDEENTITMKLSQEELNTLIAYMAIGNSSKAEEFAEEHNLEIPSFIEQTPLFDVMVEFEKITYWS